jgi:FMN-dependent NADH-azoreductase
VTALLHLDSSASTTHHSTSRQLTQLFANTWQKLHGTTHYRYRDLAANPTPLITSAYCALGIRVERHGVIPLDTVDTLVTGQAEQGEWDRTRPLINEILAADTVLLGAPMYNFSVSSALKAWIDRISFPGAFIEPNTGEKRLRDTTTIVVCARGGSYEPGDPREGFDFQAPYLRKYLTNLGIAENNLTFVNADLTRSADIPGLAPFRQRAADSLAAARDTMLELATRTRTAPAATH